MLSVNIDRELDMAQERMHRFFIGDPFEDGCIHWAQWTVIQTVEGTWECQVIYQNGFFSAFTPLFADDYEDVMDACYAFDKDA